MVCIVLTILSMVISQATLCSNTMYFQTNKKAHIFNFVQAISYSKQKHSTQGFGIILHFYLVSRQVIPIAHDFSHNLNEVLIILDDIQDLILLKICHIWTLCWPYRKDGGDEEGQLTCQKIFSINSFWLYQSCKEANRQKFSNDGSTNQ